MAQWLWAQREKTSFQTLSPWKPKTDIRSDVVMVYGAGDYREISFRDRVQSWRDHGYTTHFMSGIAWGAFDAYFKGEWDGKPHDDEVQKRVSGEGIMHGPNCFVSKSPASTGNVMRLLLPKEPNVVNVDVTSQWSWDASSRTLLLEFENDPNGVTVCLGW